MAWAEEIRTGPLAEADGGAAFVDTTTLHSALPLLWTSGGPLTPINLLDLCTIIDAVVMFDQVICFAGEDASGLVALPGLGSVVQEIGAPSGPQGGYVGSAVFGGFWDEANSYFSGLRAARSTVETDEREALEHGWKSVLGVPPELALGDPHDPVRGVYAPEVARDLSVLSATPSDEPARIAKTVGASNILGYVNEQITNMIELPYLPNTARIPAVRGYRVSRGERVARELAALDIIDDAYRARLEEAKLGTVRLPLLSAAVFAKNPSTPEQLVESIADLRERAEKLRGYRREHARLLLRADEAATGKQAMKKARASSAKLRSAVEREGIRLSDLFGPSVVLGGLAGGAPVFLNEPVNRLTLAVNVLMGAVVPPAGHIAHVVLERLFRPHLWLLTDLAESAQALNDARVRKAMKAIWRMDDARANHLTGRLSKLAETRAFA
jgi:hypothetical protein